MGAILDIVNALNRTGRVKVHGPGMPVGTTGRFIFGSNNEPARQVLARLFQIRTTDTKVPRYVWDFLYAHDYGFVLNVHTVKVESPRPDGSVVLKQLDLP